MIQNEAQKYPSSLASFAAYIENMDGYPTYAITTTKLAKPFLIQTLHSLIRLLHQYKENKIIQYQYLLHQTL